MRMRCDVFTRLLAATFLMAFVSQVAADNASSTSTTEIQSKNPFDVASAKAYLDEARRLADADTLIHAAMMHDEQLVAAVLATGVHPDTTGIVPQTALHLVASTRCQSPPHGIEVQMRIIELLLSHGADVHNKNFGNTEIIVWAAQQCPPRVVERLLQAGAKLEARSPQGYSPLSMALVVKNIETAELLIANGARLKAETIQKLFSAPDVDAKVKALAAKARQK